MRRPIAYFGFAFLLACAKPDTSNIDNLNDGRIDVLGHAGMGVESPFQHLPINSLTSLEQAIAATGADGIEIDAQLSMDDHMIAFHEQDLNYTTNCSGCIPELSLSEIIDCQYVTNHNGGSFSLTTISHMVNGYADHSSKPIMFIDCKTALQCIPQSEIASYSERFAAALVDLIQTNDRISNVWVDLQGHELAIALKQMAPDIRVYWFASDPDRDIEEAVLLGLDGITVDSNRITKEQIKNAHDAGLLVSLYDVSDIFSTREAIDKHPDHLITDNISVALDLLY